MPFEMSLEMNNFQYCLSFVCKYAGITGMYNCTLNNIYSIYYGSQKTKQIKNCQFNLDVNNVNNVSMLLDS